MYRRRTRPTVVPVNRTALLPVIGLFLVAPWMAEFSWGGLGPADMAVAVVFLGPLYGCAAILVREIARRTGRGWPTILLLGAAFGVLQAGVVDQSVFNPHYMDYDFQHPAHVPGIKVSAYYSLSFVVGHAVTSIAVPIAIVEACAAGRGRTPWLGRWGLPVVATLWVLASVLNHVDVRANDGHGFQAAPGQTGAAIAVALVLLALAFTRPRAPRPSIDGLLPPPWALAVMAFLAQLLWLPHQGWLGVAAAAVVLPAVATALARWSRRPAWGPWHVYAVVVGVVLGGPVDALTGDPYADVSARTELVNDSIATVIALALLVVGALLLRRHTGATGSEGPVAP